MSYQPNVGDKIELVRRLPGVVTAVERDRDTNGVVWLDGKPMGHYLAEFDVELVTPAPVPFEVGKPLTEAMGEPPVGSALLEVDRSSDHCIWQRHGDGWANTLGGVRIPWRDVWPYGNFMLVHLGCAE